MGPPRWSARIVCVAQPGEIADGEAVVEAPIVDGDDLEEVRDEPELSDRVVEFLGSEARERVPATRITDQPRLLRGRVQIALLAEGAVPTVLLLIDRSVSPGQTRQRSIGAPGDRPHLGAGQWVDLLDRAIGEADEGVRRGRLGGVGHVVRLFGAGMPWGWLSGLARPKGCQTRFPARAWHPGVMGPDADARSAGQKGCQTRFPPRVWHPDARRIERASVATAPHHGADTF